MNQKCAVAIDLVMFYKSTKDERALDAVIETLSGKHDWVFDNNKGGEE